MPAQKFCNRLKKRDIKFFKQRPCQVIYKAFPDNPYDKKSGGKNEDGKDQSCNGMDTQVFQAVKQGMKTLKEAGFKKVLDGVTTLEEVMRAVFI